MILEDNSRASIIAKLYKNILLREADPKGLKRYIESDLTPQQIEAELYSSKEYLEKIQPLLDKLKSERKKLLIFGAYGNGNLGDAIQAKCLAGALNKLMPNYEIWSSTALPNHYNYPKEKQLPPWGIKAAQIIKNFRAIIIGGGGLFSHPHEPLQDAEWAEGIEQPIYIVGVGATKNITHNSKELIKSSALVTARDNVSYEAFSEIRSDIRIIRDPVICTAPLTEDSSKSNATAWIIRGPLSGDHSFIRNQIREGDRVICFEPKVDCVLEELFPEIIYTPTIESFRTAIESSSLVITSRYHGAILALLSGKKVLGYGDQKIQSLFKEMEQPHLFLKNIHEINYSLTFNYSEVRQRILEWRKDFSAEISKIAKEITRSEI
jgi:Uncharacterized conserved protein